MTPAQFREIRLKALPKIIKEINRELEKGVVVHHVESVLAPDVAKHYEALGWHIEQMSLVVSIVLCFSITKDKKEGEE